MVGQWRAPSAARRRSRNAPAARRRRSPPPRHGPGAASPSRAARPGGLGTGAPSPVVARWSLLPAHPYDECGHATDHGQADDHEHCDLATGGTVVLARARISLGIARVGRVRISLVTFAAVGAVGAGLGVVLGSTGRLRGGGIVGRLAGGLVGVIAGPLLHGERGLTVDRVAVGGD